MTRVVVNETERSVDAEWQTWGDLLAALDRDLDAEGRLITSVRFDGVEDPAFRDPAITARPLSSLQQVEIEVGGAVTLVTRCLGEASQAIDALCALAARVADGFRGHDVAPANQALIELAEGLRLLVAFVGGVSLALRVDLQELLHEGEPVSSRIDELGAFVEALIAAQHAEDWVTVADIIQYDVEPALQNWRSVLQAFHQPAAA